MIQFNYASIFFDLINGNFIQMTCENLLSSDFVLDFPDIYNSFLYINEFLLQSCYSLGYKLHCGYHMLQQ
jgi:hypothetical protein